MFAFDNTTKPSMEMKEMMESSCIPLVLLCVFSLFYLTSTRIGSSEQRAVESAHNHGRNLLSKKVCTDTDWCNIEPPTKSLFRFSGPIDPNKWVNARAKAASGEQVLLSKIMKHFPNYLDFLDGDTKFRKWHHIPDFFVDQNIDLSPLTGNLTMKRKSRPAAESHKWGGKKVIPRGHDYNNANRAPILKLGYHAFSLVRSVWFGGQELGKVVVSRKMFVEHWQAVKDHISNPFIMLDVHDEHWGFASTHFPNRTATLGYCCSFTELAAVMDFLNHNKTLLAVVNQHTNITHPKLLSLPRGLPLHHDHGARLIWDTMYSTLHTNRKKNTFVSTTISDGGFRSQIMSCIAKKFKPTDFVTVTPFADNTGTKRINSKENNQGKENNLASQREYYAQLAASRVGLALPGIGYDTYRLWELLTMGSVAVIEKGVGLDKTVWRLPVLLVDDFADVTPILLRTAYIEAIYRAQENEFEFERLTQSFWYSFLMHVSRTQRMDTVLKTFPLEAEDPTFTRPVESFQCGQKGQLCGAGTKRTPRESC